MKALEYISLFFFLSSLISIYIIGYIGRKNDVTFWQFVYFRRGFDFTGKKYLQNEYVESFTIFNITLYISFIIYILILNV